MAIIDTHAHIDQLEDLDGALKRAREAGVSAIVAVSVDLASMQKILAITENRPGIHPTLGVHPGMVKPDSMDAAFTFMRAHIKRAVAVGETGLDYWYKWVRKDQEQRRMQQEAFASHLQLACASGLPIVIHSRGAWKDCLDMALDSGVKRALFHWYSGPLDVLEGILEAGFYVSTSPSVAYSPESQKAMIHAPLERVLIETDSPVNYRDGEAHFTAEPKDVIRTWKALARLKGLEEDTVLAQVNSNAKKFFGIKADDKAILGN